MTRKLLALGALALLPVLGTGCISTSAGVFSSSTPIVQEKPYTVTGKVDATAFGVIILGIPLSEIDPTRTARNRAMRGGNADGIINGQIDTMQIPIPLLQIVITRVYGDGIKFADAS